MIFDTCQVSTLGKQVPLPVFEIVNYLFIFLYQNKQVFVCLTAFPGSESIVDRSIM